MDFDIPCFVISLKRSTDRREHMTRECEREGIAFEFIDAIDGQSIPANDVRKLTKFGLSPHFGHPIEPGDVACTMSHGLAMQTVLDRGLDRAIILEDDARLANGFAEIVSSLLEAPVGWDLLKLSGSGPPRFKTVAQAGPFQIVRPELPAFMSQGYVITPAGCRKLIPFTKPVHDLFDLVVQQVWSTKADVLEVVPRPVGAIQIASTIDSRDRYHREPALVGRWVRRVWKLRRSIQKFWFRWQ